MGEGVTIRVCYLNVLDIQNPLPPDGTRRLVGELPPVEPAGMLPPRDPLGTPFGVGTFPPVESVGSLPPVEPAGMLPPRHPLGTPFQAPC
eukprot:1194327-Prorocentrum_minimum.AAC.5